MKTYILFVYIASALNIQDKWLSHRLRQESQKRQKSPDKIGKAEINKLERLGFVYDEEQKKWKREMKNEKTDVIYGRSEPVDTAEEEQWRNNMELELGSEDYIFVPSRKIRFNAGKQRSVSTELSEREDVKRLGFNFVDGKWTRGKPRNTEIVMTIESNGRAIQVSVIDEEKIRIINSFEYTLKRSQYETPMNVWDGALRVGRNPTTVFIFLAAQYKLWSLFTEHHVILGDAWSPGIDANNFEVTQTLIFLSIVNMMSTIAKSYLWDGSSGSIVQGALERSITGGILSNYTKAPVSYVERKEMGIMFVLMAACFRTISGFPRVAVYHSYIQEKVYHIISGMSHIGQSLNVERNHLIINFESSVLLGLLCVVIEAISFRWSRPPKTDYEEINDLCEMLKMDDIHIRMLEKRFDDMTERKDGKVMMNLVTSQIEKSRRGRDDFANITNVWLETFHNTNLEHEFESNKTKAFNVPVLAANFVSAFTSSLAYSTSANLNVPLFMNILSSIIEELPPPTLKNNKNITYKM